MEENEKPPKKITLNGIKYFLDEKSPGYNKEIDQDNWTELISYDYLNNDEDKVLCIEQYDDESFEASVGIVIPEYYISNILPVEEKF